MNGRPLLCALLVVAFGGCGLFHHDDAPPAAKHGFSLWPFGDKGGGDATPYLEYQRTHSNSSKTYAIEVRNTHSNRGIEGDIRTTIETADNGQKIDSMHFVLAPNESKRLLTYPDTVRLTYEVSATFRPK